MLGHVVDLRVCTWICGVVNMPFYVTSSSTACQLLRAGPKNMESWIHPLWSFVIKTEQKTQSEEVSSIGIHLIVMMKIRTESGRK